MTNGPRHFGMTRLVLVVSLVALLSGSGARAERLKDLADLRGARANQLIGYGLVVGLQNSGDDASAQFAVQSVITMLQRLGTRLDTDRLRLRNVAAVIVTAELPAFVAAGQRLDVTVSSIGNATSLEGGTLLTTPLKGADQLIYAVAQGSLTVGGYSVQSQSGSRTQKNRTTVGRVAGGAFVERELRANLDVESIDITLRSPDFTTAARIADAIQGKIAPPPAAEPPPVEPAPSASGAATDPDAAAATPPAAENKDNPPARLAEVRDAGSVVVTVPPTYRGRVAVLVAELEALDVIPDIPVRVVVNERTGTVVLGDGVRITPVAIAHGGLTLEVKETPAVSQPAPFSKGKTKVVPRSDLSAEERAGELKTVAPGASLGEVVRALNALGVTPRDLVAILQALKSAGALRANLEVQ